MVIQELKPSKRVRGRWLAVLEDGSLLRVGEGEVIQFALCTGRELPEEEAARHYSAKGYGLRKLRDELHRRGVPRELWDEALERAEDPAEAIDAFLAKKLGDTPPEDRRAWKRASDALARRGYAWSDISEGLRRYGAEWEE